ncbi:MAG: hypothetical protein ACAH09_08930 [Methylophilaceae bacterium]|jgi:hypothetical protein|nr:hypothetical protein [Methylophilaceae bacterium]
MPRGASAKREHEYQKLENKFEKEHRYPGREKEVAARIVNKQRKMYGETKDELLKDARGQSPDRNLPLPDYQKLTSRQVERKMESLSVAEVRTIRAYELDHKHRKGLLTKIDRKLSAH